MTKKVKSKKKKSKKTRRVCNLPEHNLSEDAQAQMDELRRAWSGDNDIRR